MAKGKSALLLAVRGPGSRKAAAAMFPHDSKQLTVVTDGGKEFVVQVEANYLLNRELWTEADQAWSRLQRGYDRIHKKLLSCQLHDMQYYRVTPEEAFYRTGQKTLAVKAKLKRLSFLGNGTQGRL